MEAKKSIEVSDLNVGMASNNELFSIRKKPLVDTKESKPVNEVIFVWVIHIPSGTDSSFGNPGERIDVAPLFVRKRLPPK